MVQGDGMRRQLAAGGDFVCREEEEEFLPEELSQRDSGGRPVIQPVCGATESIWRARVSCSSGMV